MLLGKFKVSGHSMEPSIKNGTEVLVSGLFFKLKKGDVIAFKNSGKMILKRIQEIKDNKVLVKGDNKSDSKEFGWIDRKELIGKVVYILG